MILVDTNVFMYAVGRPHALQTPAQDFLRRGPTGVVRRYARQRR